MKKKAKTGDIPSDVEIMSHSRIHDIVGNSCYGSYNEKVVTPDMKGAEKVGLEIMKLSCGYDEDISFALIDYDGKVIEYFDQACWAALIDGITGVKYLVSDAFSWRRANYGNEIVDYERDYLNWLIHDSWLSDVFENPDADHMWKYGVIVNTKHSPQMIHHANCCVRYLSEYRYTPRAWAFLKDCDGMTDNLLYVMMHFFKNNGSPEEGINGVTPCSSYNEHRAVISGRFTKDHIQNIISGRMAEEGKLPPAYKSFEYYGLEKVFEFKPENPGKMNYSYDRYSDGFQPKEYPMGKKKKDNFGRDIISDPEFNGKKGKQTVVKTFLDIQGLEAA